MNTNQTMKPNFIFFGTDEFAVNVLETLKTADALPKLVVTTPDTPQGRKLVLTPPPVKIWADENNVRTIQPEKLNTEITETLKSENADIFLVASYGKIIPQNILDIVPHKTLNIHPSLLPLLRGPSPLETAVMSEAETGVTIMELDSEMDHGPILMQEKYSGTFPTDYITLRDNLSKLGAELFLETLRDSPEPQEQNHDAATYTKKISKSDAEINLSDDAEKNYRKILAFSDWPRAFYFEKHAGKNIRVVITKAHLDNGELVIDRVIPEGKKEMDYADFKRGLR